MPRSRSPEPGLDETHFSLACSSMPPLSALEPHTLRAPEPFLRGLLSLILPAATAPALACMVRREGTVALFVHQESLAVALRVHQEGVAVAQRSREDPLKEGKRACGLTGHKSQSIKYGREDPALQPYSMLGQAHARCLGLNDQS
eukprot:1140485-Pelagomonas_calceolata.AAC.4